MGCIRSYEQRGDSFDHIFPLKGGVLGFHAGIPMEKAHVAVVSNSEVSCTSSPFAVHENSKDINSMYTSHTSLHTHMIHNSLDVLLNTIPSITLPEIPIQVPRFSTPLKFTHMASSQPMLDLNNQITTLQGMKDVVEGLVVRVDGDDVGTAEATITCGK